MKFVNYNGETLALCLAPPDWSEEVKLEITPAPTEITRSNTGQQSARRFGRSSRYTLEYLVRAPIDPSAAAAWSTNLRLWLQRLKGETVAVPLWTDGVEFADGVAARNTVIPKTAINPVSYGAEWIVIAPSFYDYNALVFDDASIAAELEPRALGEFEIVVVNAIDDQSITLAAPLTLDWTAGTMMYPILFGKVAERPKWEAETDEVLNGRIKFQEDSSFARRLNLYPGQVPTVGAGIPEFANKPLWDIQPDESVKSLDHTEVDILSKQIGFLRQEQKQVYSQPVRRGLQLHVYADTRDAIARVTRLFLDRHGPTKTLMVPTFRGDMRYAVYDELLYGPAPGTAIEPG